VDYGGALFRSLQKIHARVQEEDKAEQDMVADEAKLAGMSDLFD
jgi:hypothetical protein